MTDDQRDARNVKKHLRNLCVTVKNFIALMDTEMTKPGTAERGSRISRLANDLEFHNDTARHFGLGEKLRKGT